MATTDFSLGAIAKVDRDNRTHKTKDGQWIVVVKTSDNDKKADLEVFDSEDDAKKAAAEVLSSGAGTGTRWTALWHANITWVATAAAESASRRSAAHAMPSLIDK